MLSTASLTWAGDIGEDDGDAQCRYQTNELQRLLANAALPVARTGFAYGLECWSCIADDCHLDPATNYKATKVTCNEDFASCQVCALLITYSIAEFGVIYIPHHLDLCIVPLHTVIHICNCVTAAESGVRGARLADQGGVRVRSAQLLARGVSAAQRQLLARP